MHTRLLKSLHYRNIGLKTSSIPLLDDVCSKVGCFGFEMQRVLLTRDRSCVWVMRQICGRASEWEQFNQEEHVGDQEWKDKKRRGVINPALEHQGGGDALNTIYCIIALSTAARSLPSPNVLLAAGDEEMRLKLHACAKSSARLYLCCEMKFNGVWRVLI